MTATFPMSLSCAICAVWISCALEWKGLLETWALEHRGLLSQAALETWPSDNSGYGFLLGDALTVTFRDLGVCRFLPYSWEPIPLLWLFTSWSYTHAEISRENPVQLMWGNPLQSAVDMTPPLNKFGLVENHLKEVVMKIRWLQRERWGDFFFFSFFFFWSGWGH